MDVLFKSLVMFAMLQNNIIIELHMHKLVRYEYSFISIIKAGCHVWISKAVKLSSACQMKNDDNASVLYHKELD